MWFFFISIFSETKKTKASKSFESHSPEVENIPSNLPTKKKDNDKK